MELNISITQSLQNLEKSLDSLDNALEKQNHSSSLQKNLADDLNLISDDRSKLAGQLDDAMAKIARMEAANVEIDQRIGLVMVEVNQLIDGDGESLGITALHSSMVRT